MKNGALTARIDLLEERLKLVEDIVLEMGSELNLERDFRWFKLGKMCDELKLLHEEGE